MAVNMGVDATPDAALRVLLWAVRGSTGGGAVSVGGVGAGAEAETPFAPNGDTLSPLSEAG